MEKLEKRKNTLMGIIMYSVFILRFSGYFIETIIHFNDYSVASANYYLFTDFIIIATAIAAMVVMLVRKRQSGFGVTLPMITVWVGYVSDIIEYEIVYAGKPYYIGPDIDQILPLFLIVPIVVVIVFFFVPNKAMRHAAAFTVGLTIPIYIILSIVRIIDEYYGVAYIELNDCLRYVLHRSPDFILGLATYVLVLIQIFWSFKSANKQPSAVNQPYAYPQPAIVCPYTQVPAASPYPQIPITNPYPNTPVTTSCPQASVSAPYSQPSVAGPSPQPVSKEQVVAYYQNLLNQGLITQEQFDAKKNELQ